MSDTTTFVFEHWSWLNKALGITEEVRDTWWSVIAQAFCEQWRFYHTLLHISDLLQLFDQWKDRIQEPESVLLSIFFHDIVYVPASSDNEMRSIEVFRKFAVDANLPKNMTERISTMIEATISHSVSSRQHDQDLSLFLDFDLAVLGQDADVYKQYATNIRKEYIHFDDEAYKDGRTKVLRSLLSSSSLYASEELQEKYEKQARRNMLEEIDMLQSKI